MWNLWYVFIGTMVLIACLVVWAIWDMRKNWCSDGELQWTGVVLLGIVAVILLLVCLLRPLGAKENIATFNYVKEMSAQTISEGTEIENATITSKIIEMNQWLAEVKAMKDVYGNWTVYNAKEIAEQFDALTPIRMNSERDGG